MHAYMNKDKSKSRALGATEGKNANYCAKSVSERSFKVQWSQGGWGG